MTQTDDSRQRPIALVLGATGGIGGALAAKLVERGYEVRALHRSAAEMQGKVPQYDWVQGDAMNRADVVAAAEGVELIAHAVNPPGYRNWGELVLPMIDNTIAAAKASGARIVMPGTVYNFGPDAFPVLEESSPQNPVTRKGKIRVQLEERLEAASGEGVPVLIVRAGDFFGPGAGNTWFAQGIVKPGKPLSSITNPGIRGVGHQWAYLPDVAETMVQLIEQPDRIPRFARFHMDGFYDPDGRQMAEVIRRVSGKPDLKTKAFPWWLASLASPFVPIFRELLEMRYLWNLPLRMTNRRLVSFLGAEPHTPIDEAMRATLASLGCLEATIDPHADSGRLARRAAMHESAS
ncbi:membrane protein [Ciceribacter naphthalenivorans]|uniref:Membrane protein n=3 Tax=Alphaproteobacteria TaxID=28211 RepID=A0A512HEL6_9HYPH|nr:NAD-dependent epimerase/dehydratase family protein [Sphingomonas psychrolutea]GEO83894.1 membrane protein [Ciceribacter naphthalenivorans]GLR21228.1 membrane protein [Ciceribacter naphthalenivorans]GLT04084.1 membrane protein [Sphingomonas psychrolutea]